MRDEGSGGGVPSAATSALATRDSPPAAAPSPPLDFVQVAFSGHNRAVDLGDILEAAQALDATLVLLGQAGVREARLLTGAEEGADRLAIEAWRAAGLGPVQVVSPFLEGFPEHVEGVDAATRLPGSQSQDNGRSPHLAQARWLVAAADVLVVFWTGRPPRGPGGTGDVVRLALEHGVPVIWAQPGAERSLRLIHPEHLEPDIGLLELQRLLKAGRSPLVTEATPAALRSALLGAGVEPDTGEPLEPDDITQDGQLRPWRTYGVFRRVLGGRPQARTSPKPPADLIAQPGFASLTATRAAAANAARRLASIHRSQQVILLGVAILAAVAGSASALLPEWKTALVAIELVLALLALVAWLGSERGARHRRWTEARKLAEDLRLERAGWTLGVSSGGHGPHAGSSKAARRARRLAGLPTGAFDDQRVRAWGDWVVEELITAQIAYHREQARVDGHISHRVHLLENISFGILLVVLTGYLIAAGVWAMQGHHPPNWLAGVVVMTGAIVPAIGAAGLALEATLSLSEQARRSRALAVQLEALCAEAGPLDRLERLQAVIRAALRLHRQHEDHWSEEVGRRRLFRGG